MSIKEDLKALVQLQARELELVRVDNEIAAIEQARETARAEIAAAEAVVKKAEQDVEDALADAKRLDLDLKSAEDVVSKFKDQMHNVKTNEQLWAIQEDIGHAEKGVGDVETKILEDLEIADSLKGVIDEKKAELIEDKKRVDAETAEADRTEAELVATRAEVEAAIAELTGQVPADLMGKYEGIRALRGGVGVAEVFEEYCLVCNTKVRPQLYVETFNLTDIMRCENCKRIIFVAEPLGLAAKPAPAAAGDAADLPVAAHGEATNADSTADVTS
jgi:hypothetical protein